MKRRIAGTMMTLVAITLLSAAVLAASSKPSAPKPAPPSPPPLRIAPLGATLKEIEKYFGPYTHVRGSVGNIWTRDEWPTARRFDTAGRYYFHPTSKGMKLRVEVAFVPDYSQSQLDPTFRSTYYLFIPDKVMPLKAFVGYVSGLVDLMKEPGGVVVAGGDLIDFHGWSDGFGEMALGMACIHPGRQHFIGFAIDPAGKAISPETFVKNCGIGTYDPYYFYDALETIQVGEDTLEAASAIQALTGQKGSLVPQRMATNEAGTLVPLPLVPTDEADSNAGRGIFYHTNFEDLALKGELVNTSATGYSEVMFAIQFYDAKNRLMKIEHYRVENLEAHSTVSFDKVLGPWIHDAFTYRVEFEDGTESKETPTTPNEASVPSVPTDVGGSSAGKAIFYHATIEGNVIRGDLQNTSRTSYHEAAFALQLYDESKRLVNTERFKVADLDATSTVPFSYSVETPLSGLLSYRIVFESGTEAQ